METRLSIQMYTVERGRVMVRRVETAWMVWSSASKTSALVPRCHGARITCRRTTPDHMPNHMSPRRTTEVGERNATEGFGNAGSRKRDRMKDGVQECGIA